MAWCNDSEEPECEGFTCPKWGKCAYSKDVMAEDPNVLEEWTEYKDAPIFTTTKEGIKLCLSQS